MTTTEAEPAAPAAIPAPLGPDSLTWRLGFPRTGLLLGGRALLMQVAHPTVGAGVHDHSNFEADPWGRLERTVDSLLDQLFGGERARVEGRRLREMHRSIQGTGLHGQPYRALEPEAYAWVHMANFDTTVVFNNLFVHPLRAAETRRLFAEWRQVGRVLGIADRHLPADLHAFHRYVVTMIAVRLEDNVTVQTLLRSLRLHGVAPPHRAVPRPVWSAACVPGGALLSDITVGTLPPALRSKLGLSWSPGQQRRLDLTASAIRVASARLPDRVLQYPQGQRARRAARHAAS